MDGTSVLVTGAGGYLGRAVIRALAGRGHGIGAVTALDVRPVDDAGREHGVEYVTCDIRSPDLADLMKRQGPQVVVHLAAVVSPGRKSDREFEYSVDVLGTKNVLESCIEAGVGKVIVTSSGAAYGYYADNAERLCEDDPIRGNAEFAYSDHKRQVEEMLAAWREEHPDLKQIVFRPGTILGAAASNQITDLFDKPFVLGLAGVDSPFVIIWDKDVVGAIIKGVTEDITGIYNLAGDGVLTLSEMASIMGKPYLPLPVGVVRGGLWVLKRLGLTQYGPEQVNFLRYRPVLSNDRLKEEFGYTPKMTTRQVFDYFLENREIG